MGTIGGMLGTAGGAGGTGFAGPQGYGIQAPVTPEQVNAANQGVGQSLASQNALLAALQNAGGVGNQAQTFAQGQGLNNQLAGLGGTGLQGGASAQQQALNTQIAGLGGAQQQGAAMLGQGRLAGQLAGAGGVGAQQQALAGLQGVAGQQQMTAAQLQGIANGTGPNPAQAMLAEQTGQNVATQAALMAGQRGAGANVGLMARQAGQQGAATQQQAVGQSATMQAQQQLAAIQSLGAQQQQQAATQQAMAGIGAGLTGEQQAALAAQYGQGAGTLGQLQAGIGQQFGQGATTVGQQQAQQGINAGIAQNQIGNTLQAQQGAVQGNIANAGQQMGSLNAMNSAGVSNQGSINAANSGMASSRMGSQGNMIGGALQGIGTAVAASGARGGYVAMADGGMPYMAPQGQGPTLAPQPQPMAMPGPVTAPPPGPQSSFGQYLLGRGNTADMIKATPQEQPDEPAAIQQPTNPDALWRGSQIAGQAGAQALMGALAAGGGGVRDLRGGGSVQARTPGEKAVKSGNSYANDKIDAKLSEGEVVIPRSVMQSSDPARSAADFVAKVIAKRGHR